MKKIIKKFIPKRILNLRHLFYAWWGAVKYGHPSRELLVIGVTGTSGKSTTVFLLRQLLEKTGYTVGSLSTIDFYVAGEDKLNDQKMTMLGKTQTQKYLREMVEKKCDIAIIETTSEGSIQHRHRFINYDTIVLTNLYPEHIESHGSFGKYKQAKLDIFKYIASTKRKMLDGKKIPKTCIVNAAVEYADEFLDHPFDTTYIYARNDVELYVEKERFDQSREFVIGKDVHVDRDGLHFSTDHTRMEVHMYGEHNIQNMLAVFTVARSLDISWKDIQIAAKEFSNAPGRIEFIKEAKTHGFQIIVDYAFEPKAIAGLYKVVHLLDPKRVIHVFGSTGGGRDISRRFSVGEFVGKHADICIVTDEDPYDDDPMSIIDDVASAVIKTGKKEGESIFKILDRKKAIEKAVMMAKDGDLVLITGKGSEQAMCVAGGEKITWDDRSIARNVIASKL